MANGAPRAHHGDTNAHRHPALDHDQAIDPATPGVAPVSWLGQLRAWRSLALAGVHLASANICHTTPMPYLTWASEAGTLRPWSTTAVCFPSAEEHDTDAT